MRRPAGASKRSLGRGRGGGARLLRQHEALRVLGALKLGEHLVELSHRPGDDGGTDAVLGAELEHLDDLLAPARVRGRDVVHREAHREHIRRDGRAHADEAHGAARAQQGKELGEVDGLLRPKQGGGVRGVEDGRWQRGRRRRRERYGGRTPAGREEEEAVKRRTCVARVTRMKSSDEAASAIAASSPCATNVCAPSASASSFLDVVDERAVTVRPSALANLIAMWPRPPNPRTPTLSLCFVCCTSGVQTVCPPHSSGAVVAESHSSGMAKANLLSAMRI